MDFKNNYWSFYWYHLHYLSIKYPDNPTDDQKKTIINLINNMKEEGIPCSICRDHFIKFANSRVIDSVISGKKNLFTFFLDCHNEVNIQQKKRILLYDEAFDYYSKDIIIKNKKYKWENILSVELDGNREILIITLFNNQKLNSFPKIFTNNFEKEYRRIQLLIESSPALTLPPPSESHLDLNSSNENTKKNECPCKKIKETTKNLKYISNQVKQYLNRIKKYTKKKLY